MIIGQLCNCVLYPETELRLNVVSQFVNNTGVSSFNNIYLLNIFHRPGVNNFHPAFEVICPFVRQTFVSSKSSKHRSYLFIHLLSSERFIRNKRQLKLLYTLLLLYMYKITYRNDYPCMVTEFVRNPVSFAQL